MKPIPANYGEILRKEAPRKNTPRPRPRPANYRPRPAKYRPSPRPVERLVPHQLSESVPSPVSWFDSVMLLLIAALCLVVIFYAIALVVGLIIFIFSHIAEILGTLALLFILALISPV